MAPWGCDAADTFQFQTLDHRHYRSPTDTMLMYVAGGVAAYVLLTMVAHPPAYLPRCGAQVGSMLATVGDATGTRAIVDAASERVATVQAVSARAAATVVQGINDTASTVAGAVGDVASAVVGGSGNVMPAATSATTRDVPADAGVTLVDASGSRKSADAWQTMTDAEKAKCEAAARGFLKSHDQVVVMLYAPWCPHCHHAMKPFAEASKAHKEIEFLMINAEALPRSAFQGENAMYNLQYFPSFATQTYRGAPLAEASSMEAAVDQLPKQEDTAAVSAKVAAATLDEEADAAADPFAALF